MEAWMVERKRAAAAVQATQKFYVIGFYGQILAGPYDTWKQAQDANERDFRGQSGIDARDPETAHEDW